MQEHVLEKLHKVFNTISGRCHSILDLFIEQFGEDNVDSNIVTFDVFLHKIETKTPGQLGISAFSGKNNFGEYAMDPDDYEKNGRGKPLLEYMPDLGILDFLIPTFKQIVYPSDRYFIIVHFPKVRVTNEYDKFVDIQDLYVKVHIDSNGLMADNFHMTRTTFPYSHFKVHYAHSHLPLVCKNDIGNWHHPCLGSGPIGHTQLSLKRTYDINLWGLFVYELSKYVTIESVSGGPHIRLETIGQGDLVTYFRAFCCLSPLFIHSDNSIDQLLKKFIRHYAESNKFKVKFVKGQYQLGEDPVEVCIHMSNDFLEWYNSISCHFNVPSITILKNVGVLGPYIIANGSIYTRHNESGTGIADARDIDGRKLFEFKGKDVNLKIIVDEDLENQNTSWLFPKKYCEIIITKVLSIINYNYGKRNGVKKQADPTQTYPGEKSIVI